MDGDRYERGKPLTKDGLFQLVTDEVFRNGKVEPYENELLTKLARFLKLDPESARSIAATSLRKFEGGEFGPGRSFDSREVYRRVVSYLRCAGPVEGLAEEMLKGLRILFRVTGEFHDKLMNDPELPKAWSRPLSAVSADDLVSALKGAGSAVPVPPRAGASSPRRAAAGKPGRVSPPVVPSRPPVEATSGAAPDPGAPRPPLPLDGLGANGGDAARPPLPLDGLGANGGDAARPPLDGLGANGGDAGRAPTSVDPSTSSGLGTDGAEEGPVSAGGRPAARRAGIPPPFFRMVGCGHRNVWIFPAVMLAAGGVLAYQAARLGSFPGVVLGALLLVAGAAIPVIDRLTYLAADGDGIRVHSPVGHREARWSDIRDMSAERAAGRIAFVRAAVRWTLTFELHAGPRIRVTRWESPRRASAIEEFFKRAHAFWQSRQP